MKHLIDIKNFLLEALTPEFQEKYKKHFEKRSEEVIDRLNKLLDNKERVYIPYSPETVSETQLNVVYYLKTIGYKIMDYKLNQAVQIENPKRAIRISKLLAKKPELLKEFTLDSTRTNVRKGSDFSIVLTSNYEDVAGMSFCRDWGSCMDIRSGSNKGFIKEEIEQGTVVAYLIKSDDLNIDNPLGRVNIKPYNLYSLGGTDTTTIKDRLGVIYIPDIKVYGNVPDQDLFLGKIINYLQDKQKWEYGFYRKVTGLYSDDGSPEIIVINKDLTICYGCRYDKDGYNHWGYSIRGYDRDGYDSDGYDRDGYDKEGYDKKGIHRDVNLHDYKEHMSNLDYNFLKKVIRGTFEIDTEGFINVDGDVDWSHQGIVSILPFKFGIVDGDFDCRANNLKSLEGCPKEIYGDFDFSHNDLTDLKYFPTVVDGDVFSYHNLQLFSTQEILEICNVGGKIKSR
jgi:hypothetical protein